MTVDQYIGLFLHYKKRPMYWSSTAVGKRAVVKCKIPQPITAMGCLEMNFSNYFYKLTAHHFEKCGRIDFNIV